MSNNTYNKEIQELLDAPEGEHYEFKEAKNRFGVDEAAKYLCAMSNCGGGRLVLGVSDKRPRQVVGSEAFSQPESTVRHLMDKLRVRVDFQLYEHDGKRVLVLEVASRPVGFPIQVEGIAWWRDGDSLVPISESVRRLIYLELESDFSSKICKEATIDDLNSSAINKFRKKWFDHTRNKRIGNLSDEQLLRDCGAITDKGVTYAALILFGNSKILRQQLPHADVVFEYRSKEAAGPAAQREEFNEGFFTYDDRIWELVNLRNDEQFYRSKLYKHPVLTFNEDVVREAVLNAVSHRDYQLGGSIFVRQYKNRLVVESPGGFPHGITVDNILDRQNARNKLIANIFKLCGLVERSGQGMNLIYEMAIKEAKPLPDFGGSDAFFVMMTLTGTVISSDMLAFISGIDDNRLNAITINDYLNLILLFKQYGYERIDRAQFKHLEELKLVRLTDNDIELVGTSVSSGRQAVTTTDSSDEFVDRDVDKDVDRDVNKDVDKGRRHEHRDKIFEIIKSNPKVSANQLSKAVGINLRNTQIHIKALKEAGLIDRVGSPKGGHWVVISS